MSESWFRSKIDADNGALQSQAEPLRELLSGNTSADKAAARIASDGFGREDAAWQLWAITFDAAAELPDTHAALLDLLVALRKLCDFSTSRTDDAAATNVAGWLNQFGSNWRDRDDILLARRDGSYDKANAAEQQPSARSHEKWINFTCFSAKLLAVRFPSAATALYALAALQDALEREPSDYYRDYEAHKAKASAYRSASLEPQEMLAVDVTAAAQWILHAAPVVRGESERPERFTRSLPAKAGLWKGDARFSPERWAFWKERFQALAEREDLGQDTRAIAKEAADRME
jgi:hypothetical protein